MQKFDGGAAVVRWHNCSPLHLSILFSVEYEG
jgi:hypothetical protein